jgi:soluble lytic murein transglycosylase
MSLPILFILATWLCTLLPAIADEADLARQRQDFRTAREALARSDVVTFERLLPGLTDYPLYGYLLYDDLETRLDNALDSEVRAFLTHHGDLPVAATLRAAWLKRLAAEERWSDLLADYRETQDPASRCLHVRARFATLEEGESPSPALMDEVRALWQVGKTQPAECEAAFTAWQAAGGMTPTDLWQRITLAFAIGNVSLAEQLGARLPAVDRPWVQVWARVHRDPGAGLGDPLLATDSPRARTVVRHGIARLARMDVTAAVNRWEDLKAHYHFDADEIAATERAIALRAAYDRHPRALALLEHLPEADGEVRRARARAALWGGDWAAVLRHVRALQPGERTADRWRYWEARALEETGQPGAEVIYDELAGHRGYYGFLAADHVHRPYSFNHHPLTVVDTDLARLEARPAVVRAHELFLTGYLPDGRREWMAAIAGSSTAELVAAAQLAARWGWPDRVIATLARSPEEDDLVLRFPLEYRDQVLTWAAAAGVSPAVVYAVVRQESVFMADATSSAGALGLMQILPATATQIARSIKIPVKGNAELFDPDRNLRLGSVFLARLVDRYGNLALGVAAYNAGPGRVKQWRPAAPMAADVWVESIPFDETRRYVRNVLTYGAIYNWRLEQPVVRLTDRMPAVEP